MKNLYVRLVLWLIRPALDADAESRRVRIDPDALAKSTAEFFAERRAHRCERVSV